MQQLEARVCQCGCGRTLLTKTGAPDLKKRFYDKPCQNLDKALKTRLMDAKLKLKAAVFQRRLTSEMARTLKKITEASTTTPLKLMVRGRPVIMSTPAGVLALAKQFPEILKQVDVEPVLPHRKCSASKPSSASSPTKTVRRQKRAAASA